MTSFLRRSFLMITMAFALAACEEHTALVAPETASQIRITEIRVNTNALPRRSDGKIRTGREAIVLTPDQFASHLKNELNRQITTRALNGPTPAVLTVSPTRLALVSPGQSFLVGGRSLIEGVVSVKSTKGQVLLAPITINGFTDELRSGGLIGAASAPPAQEDYQRTLEGFANNVTRKLFENLTVGVGGTVLN